MSDNFLFGISLTGSFLAGNLALFAPCCITFLLPSYLGTIFKKTEKVFFYTLIFSLGLATILVPVALGFRFIVSLFDAFHGAVYYLGSGVLVLMGLMTYFEMKTPFSLSLAKAQSEKVDVASVYSLGIISGLTSSCCAPVLFAAITLTSLSPTIFQAFFVALAYIVGIVFPLFLLSFFYDKASSRVLAKAKKNVYQIFKFLGAAIFIGSGIIIAVLNYQGKIVMGSQMETSFWFRMAILSISKYFKNPLIDLVSFALILYLFFFLLRKKGSQVTIDPVCGMKVDPKKTPLKKRVAGKIYYFCSKACLESFKNQSQK